jgi:hypothetical protein
VITFNSFNLGVPLEKVFFHADDSSCPCQPQLVTAVGLFGQLYIALMHDEAYTPQEKTDLKTHVGAED